MFTLDGITQDLAISCETSRLFVCLLSHVQPLAILREFRPFWALPCVQSLEELRWLVKRYPCLNSLYIYLRDTERWISMEKTLVKILLAVKKRRRRRAYNQNPPLRHLENGPVIEHVPLV